MPDANPPILKPKHNVVLELPLSVADKLIAKGGSMEAAMNKAINNYLLTDYKSRDAKIKEFVELGRDVEKLAEFHGLTPDDILAIAGR